jgi:hypothetical protein
MSMLRSQRRKAQTAARSYDAVVLERFQAKWRPVRGEKTRRIKKPERSQAKARPGRVSGWPSVGVKKMRRKITSVLAQDDVGTGAGGLHHAGVAPETRIG